MKEVLEQIVYSSQEEVSFLEELSNKLSGEEFYNLKKSTIEKFVNNDDMVNFVLERNLFTWEISTILEKSDNEIFSNTLEYLVSDLRESFLINKKKSVEVFENYYEDVHEALNAYHDSFFIHNIRDNGRLRHYVRTCFRHIGDTLEASFKPYIIILYNLLIAGEHIKAFVSRRPPAFGDYLTHLIDIDYLKRIYIDELKGISLSQWRNICQHSSYKVDEESNTITCNYGKNKSKVFTTSDIEHILLKLDELHSIHMIAISFIMLEFTSEINLKSELKDLSVETILGDMCSALSTYQYPVIEVIQEEEKYKFVCLDKNGNLKSEFIKSLHHVASHIFMLKDKGISSVFGLYSIDGIKIAEGKLELEFPSFQNLHSKA